jgi:hypothetical protein
VLSVYHFSTFINRRKRKDDRVDIPRSGSVRDRTA